jgi:hypothetical protein
MHISTTRFLLKDRSRFQALMSGAPIFDSKKLYKGAFAVVTDVSKLKQIEESLGEREKR